MSDIYWTPDVTLDGIGQAQQDVLHNYYSAPVNHAGYGRSRNGYSSTPIRMRPKSVPRPSARRLFHDNDHHNYTSIDQYSQDNGSPLQNTAMTNNNFTDHGSSSWIRTGTVADCRSAPPAYYRHSLVVAQSCRVLETINQEMNGVLRCSPGPVDANFVIVSTSEQSSNHRRPIPNPIWPPGQQQHYYDQQYNTTLVPNPTYYNNQNHHLLSPHRIQQHNAAAAYRTDLRAALSRSTGHVIQPAMSQFCPPSSIYFPHPGAYGNGYCSLQEDKSPHSPTPTPVIHRTTRKDNSSRRRFSSLGPSKQWRNSLANSLRGLSPKKVLHSRQQTADSRQPSQATHLSSTKSLRLPLTKLTFTPPTALDEIQDQYSTPPKTKRRPSLPPTPTDTSANRASLSNGSPPSNKSPAEYSPAEHAAGSVFRQVRSGNQGCAPFRSSGCKSSWCVNAPMQTAKSPLSPPYELQSLLGSRTPDVTRRKASGSYASNDKRASYHACTVTVASLWRRAKSADRFRSCYIGDDASGKHDICVQCGFVVGDNERKISIKAVIYHSACFKCTT